MADNSQQALQDIQNFDATRANPTDVLSQAEGKHGIDQSRQRLVGLRSAIMGTEGLLNNVAGDVQGRTSRSLFGEAARNRLIANERAPIAEQYSQQQGALSNENASLTDAQSQAAKEAQLRLTGDDTKRNSLQSLYDTLYKREQDELARQRAEQARQDALAEAARQRASSSAANSYMNTSNRNSNSASAPKLSLRQQWQREANQGDWNAQVGLNYAGDDGRYDGVVNSQSEYNILKNMGIKGNYYVAKNVTPKAGGSIYGVPTINNNPLRR